MVLYRKQTTRDLTKPNSSQTPYSSTTAKHIPLNFQVLCLQNVRAVMFPLEKISHSNTKLFVSKNVGAVLQGLIKHNLGFHILQGGCDVLRIPNSNSKAQHGFRHLERGAPCSEQAQPKFQALSPKKKRGCCSTGFTQAQRGFSISCTGVSMFCACSSQNFQIACS